MKSNIEKTEETSNLKQLVVSFFYRSAIVYTCPGMKDSIAIWENGKKLTLQKHYLTSGFLKEDQRMFSY